MIKTRLQFFLANIIFTIWPTSLCDVGWYLSRYKRNDEERPWLLRSVTRTSNKGCYTPDFFKLCAQFMLCQCDRFSLAHLYWMQSLVITCIVIFSKFAILDEIRPQSNKIEKNMRLTGYIGSCMVQCWICPSLTPIMSPWHPKHVGYYTLGGSAGISAHLYNGAYRKWAKSCRVSPSYWLQAPIRPKDVLRGRASLQKIRQPSSTKKSFE